MKTILTSSTKRHYPCARFPDNSMMLTNIEAARNERFSFQLALRSETAQETRVDAEGPDGWGIRVRRVGLVPQPHHNTPVMADALDMDGLGHVPGYTPDPLFDEQSMLLPQDELHSFWFSVTPSPQAEAGDYRIKVKVTPENDGEAPQELRLEVKLRDVVIPERKGFLITHWLYSDQLIDWYKTDLFDKRFWEILEAYIRNMVEHGLNVLYVPMFTPPLDGVKRPSQLLRVATPAKGRYDFDWDDVKRYVTLARSLGITHFEWTHLFTQWGVKHAIRIYEGQGEEESLLWEPETEATSETYRGFLAQFLPSFKRFLDEEGLLENSLFHVSDEPKGEEMLANYNSARAMLRELAPWMSCMDAISEIEFARAVDMPIPSIRTALSFLDAGVTAWCYYCCGPRGAYLNRLLDTPLAKVAMHGFLFYRWPFKGFLHWGYNYWCESQKRNLIDPFTVSDGKRWPNWAYGDTFAVYPGPAGPLDSIRWEIFSESLQDYALLQAASMRRDDEMLEELRDFDDFPKDADWRLNAKRKLYDIIEGRRK